MHTYLQKRRTYKRPANALPDVERLATLRPLIAQTGELCFVLRVPVCRRPSAVTKMLYRLDPGSTWDLITIDDDESVIPLQAGAVAPVTDAPPKP